MKEVKGLVKEHICITVDTDNSVVLATGKGTGRMGANEVGIGTSIVVSAIKIKKK